MKKTLNLHFKLCTFLLCFCMVGSAYTATDSNAQFNTRLTAVEKQIKKRILYNAPAHAKVVDGYNLFLTGDLLYWKAEENGLTYAIKTKNPQAQAIQGSVQLKDPHFKWDFGFRAGLGFIIPHDHWDLYFNWTQFNTQAHSHCKTNEALFPVWALPSGPLLGTLVSNANSRWKLDLSIFDVELGKEYYVGKKLCLRPYLGLRTGFIDQSYKINYEADFLDQIKLKNTDWGVGPRIGFNSQWWLKYGFSFYSDLAISMIFGRNSLDQKEEPNLVPEESFRFKQHLHVGRAITDIGLYFGWDHMLFRDQFHIGVKGGWEQHIFFQQNQFFRFLDPSFQGSIVSNQGNLMLQGWTFNARIDF